MAASEDTSEWPQLKTGINREIACITKCTPGTVCLVAPEAILKNRIPENATIRGCILLLSLEQ